MRPHSNTNSFKTESLGRLSLRLCLIKVNFRKSLYKSNFRSFESMMPSVILVCKDGIVLSKPRISLEMLENLHKFSLCFAQNPSLTLEDDARIHSSYKPTQ